VGGGQDRRFGRVPGARGRAPSQKTAVRGGNTPARGDARPPKRPRCAGSMEGLTRGGCSGIMPDVSEPFLANARVLAIDQREWEVEALWRVSNCATCIKHTLAACRP
jgi:hypothetical protein